MDTSITQEDAVETAANEQELYEPLDEQETLLLDEVAQVYFEKVAEDMRGRVGLSAGQRVPDQKAIDDLCTLGYSVRGVVAHAEDIRKFKNLPGKVTLTKGQMPYLEVLFKLSEVMDDIEDIARRIEELP